MRSCFHWVGDQGPVHQENLVEAAGRMGTLAWGNLRVAFIIYDTSFANLRRSCCCIVAKLAHFGPLGLQSQTGIVEVRLDTACEDVLCFRSRVRLPD